jgi:hypothetical protein
MVKESIGLGSREARHSLGMSLPSPPSLIFTDSLTHSGSYRLKHLQG